MTEYNQKKRAESIEYLRSRNKYVIESDFVPTPAVATNVAKTIEDFKRGCHK
jgi:hypothetical protein